MLKFFGLRMANYCHILKYVGTELYKIRTSFCKLGQNINEFIHDQMISTIFSTGTGDGLVKRTYDGLVNFFQVFL